MAALAEITTYLIQTFIGLFLIATLVRLLLQMTRADFYNPISQAFVKLTNPAILPLRKLIPSFKIIDLPTFILAVALETSLIALLCTVNSYPVPDGSLLLVWAFLGTIGLLVKIYFFALLLMIILSWIAPTSYHPAIQLIHQILEPTMKPVRKILPPIGGLDFSPIAVFILINIFEIMLRHVAGSVNLVSKYVMGI